MTMDTILYTGVTTLAAAVGLLYKRVESGLKNCEEDRRLLWQAILKNQAEDRAAFVALRDPQPKP